VSNSDTTEPTEQAVPGQLRSLVLWLLITLAAGALLALLSGSATPRIRLLGIYPLALGALIAFGALGLLAKFDLKLDKILFGWIILLAMTVAAGSTAWSWQIWKKQVTEEFAREYPKAQAKLEFILKEIDPVEQEKLHLEHLLRFHNSIRFASYLSDRLRSFSERLGRKNVWDPPVPEVMFCLELFLALVGAWVVALQGMKARPEA
jgi:hypothetical protein